MPTFAYFTAGQHMSPLKCPFDHGRLTIKGRSVGLSVFAPLDSAHNTQATLRATRVGNGRIASSYLQPSHSSQFRALVADNARFVLSTDAFYEQNVLNFLIYWSRQILQHMKRR